jgi:hypothetical protein
MARRFASVLVGKGIIGSGRGSRSHLPGGPRPGRPRADGALVSGSLAGHNSVRTGLGRVRCFELNDVYEDGWPPESLPVLSRGKHRGPRNGACFMEFASLLAGERWSDHPACTHPLLAAVARHVNDHTSDAGRSRLAELIPSVIGLTGDDLHIDVQIALRSARIALPVVAAERQRVMAISVLASERLLADLDGRPVDDLGPQSRSALAQVPEAAKWAYRFSTGVRPTPKRFRRQIAPSIVASAVEGIARACIPDPDALLRHVLVGAISDCAAWCAREPRREAALDAVSWEAACRLTAGIRRR